MTVLATTVHVHVERLVIDGGDLSAADGRAVGAAFTAELARLLGASSAVPAPAHADWLRVAPVSADAWRSPAALGTAAAQTLAIAVVPR